MRRHRALAIAGFLAGTSAGPDAFAGDEGSAEEVEARSEPATRAATKLRDALREIEATMVTTEYRHGTVVRRREGHYAWDCSGMTNWLLRRLAPRAFAALDRERPVASSYWRVIDRAPTGTPRRGWQRIADIRDVRPGDVFAWRRPPDWPPGGNTGHVGFVLEAPKPVAKYPGKAFTVRIADATSLPHDEDSRDPEGAGGFGTGTLMFAVDESGDVWAYGWFGARSRGVIPTDIVFGRVHG